MLRAAKSPADSPALEAASFEPAPLKSHKYVVLLDLGFSGFFFSFKVPGF